MEANSIAWLQGYEAIRKWHCSVGFCPTPPNPFPEGSQYASEWSDGASQAYEDAENLRWLDMDADAST